MTRILLLIIFALSIVKASLSQAAMDPVDPASQVEKGSQTALMPLMPSWKLDLMKFEAGLVEGNELYWCEDSKNSGNDYKSAMLADFKQGVETSLTPEDAEAVALAFHTFFSICDLADAQDYLTQPKYQEAFETLLEIRDVVINDWPR